MASKVKDKKTVSTNNYVALVAVATSLVVLGSAFVLKNLAADLIVNGKVIAGKQRAVGDLEQKLENAPKLVEAYKALGPTRDLIANSLPNTADFPQLASIIENMASNSGVAVRSISPATGGSAEPGASAPGTAAPSAPSPSAPSPVPYMASVSVQGSYTRTVDFARSIQLSARPMQVTSVTMQGSGNSIQSDFTIMTYYQPEADISDRKETVK